MPEATLRFTLPEEHEEYILCQKASDIDGCLRDVVEDIRRRRKYGEYTAECDALLESIWERIFELAKEYDVEVW